MPTPNPSLDQAMLKDRHSLRRIQRDIQRRQKQKQPVDRLEQTFSKKLQQSVERANARRDSLPTVTYPSDLPVSQNAEHIINTIRDHNVVVIAGETGSGKSTQLPKMCLAAGRGIYGKIAHTQPRRLAARSLANRVSNELERPLGETVGYKVRFQDQVSDSTLIKLLTDGMLLAELQGDRFLEEYDTIIIDEAHERSLNIDFILGYLKKLLQKRADLKVIITSATIDFQRFSKHFNDAPVIEVSGRTFDVDVKYRPLDDNDDSATLDKLVLSVVNDINAHATHSTLPSGTLFFLPGERDIHHFSNLLRKHGPKELEILPLYSRLSNADQEKIFRPSGRKRIVLATNVAETSITVPDIGYVIDMGTVRISRYSARSKMQRLPIEPISQASANQRKGRCGRLASGVCYRLYSEDDFLGRPEFTDPEILRTNLGSVILQMAHLGLGDIDHFPFIEPPNSHQVSDGYKLLEELGAINQQQQLTDIGRKIAKLPTEPRLARILIEAQKLDCVAEAITIVSALSIPDPRIRGMERPQAADQAHAEFADKQSDFVTYLNLWAAIQQEREDRSNNGFKKWLEKNYLSFMRVKEWREIHYQLTTMTRGLSIKPNKEPADFAAIHRALLSGFISHVGMREERRLYKGTRNRKFVPFPGSALHRGNANWVMAAEIVETEKVYGRTLASIQPEWIIEQGKHLLKHRYFEPHWEKKRASAMAYLELSLLGLIVDPKKNVNFSNIEPQQSREIFIYNALVAGDIDTRAPFMRHNKKLIADTEERENRTRRRDILVDDSVLFEWFDARIPQHIVNGKRFDQWRKKAEAAEPRLLFLSVSDISRSSSDSEGAQYSFPDALDVAGGKLTIDYQFEPGKYQDGLTVEVPLTLLNQVDPYKLEWLVPGLERDKCIALIKSLPKTLRKHLVPAPNYADAFLQSDPDRQQSLYAQFADFLKRHNRVDVRPESWRLDHLPQHLLAKIRVLDNKGKLLEESADIYGLKHRLQGDVKHVVASLLSDQIDQSEYQEWNFDDVSEEFQHESNGKVIIMFPAIVDCGNAVRLQMFDDARRARSEMEKGILRLALLALPQQIRYLKKHCQLPAKTAIKYVSFGDKNDLETAIVTAAFHQTFVHNQPLVRSRKAFLERIERQKSQLVTSANQVKQLLDDILTAHHNIEAAMQNNNSPSRAATYDDIRFQLNELLPKNWINYYDVSTLGALPRYLNAITIRITKLQGNVDRDQSYIPELTALWSQYAERLGRHQESGKLDPELQHYRWMLEELRISLFAQGLKTRYPVSFKRLEKQWDKVAP